MAPATPAPEPKIETPAPTPVGQVQATIIKWANHYGVDANWLLRIAECESRYRPGAVNLAYWVDANGIEFGTVGGKFYPSGVFQHVAKYWPGRAAHYGVPGASIFDAEAQARVTAGMFRDGQSNLWECK